MDSESYGNMCAILKSRYGDKTISFLIKLEFKRRRLRIGGLIVELPSTGLKTMRKSRNVLFSF